jgi:aspartate aminotransferase
MVRKALSQRTTGIRLSEIRGVVKKVGEARSKGIEIADFSAGTPDFDTPAHIKEAAKKALDEGLVHYAASVGQAELRQAICERFHEDYEWEIDPDEIVITMGSTEAI